MNHLINKTHKKPFLAISLATMLMGLPACLIAGNTITDMQFSTEQSGRVDLTVTFAEPVDGINAFETSEPASIILDADDTRLAISDRKLTVGTGATNKIVASESSNKSRIMIDLYRPAAYEQKIIDNQLIVSIAPGAGATANAGSSAMFANTADPSEQVISGTSIDSVDFKRTPDGSGQVIIRFSGDGAVAEMNTTNGHVLVDIPSVSVPANKRQNLDVVDFATPVRNIAVTQGNNGAALDISTNGMVESLAYQTGNEYIIEISQVSEEEADTANKSVTLGDAAKKTYSGTPVTFNFQDIPVRTVLQLIADESGLNIVAADAVEGTVTLRLNSVPWDQALDIVMQSKGLDKRQEGNVIWIAPQAEISAYEKAKAEATLALQKSQPLITEYIPVNYSAAEDIVGLLTTDAESSQTGSGQQDDSKSVGFLSQRGSVSFDMRTNTIILNDIPSKIEEIKDLIKLLDRPVDQVMIEARIVIANEDFSKDLGARFGVSGGERDFITHGTSESVANYINTQPDATNPNRRPTWLQSGRNINLPATPANGTAGSLAMAILSGNYMIDLELSALQVEGKGEIVANPRVITSNQTPAVIKQGDEIGYVVIQDTGGVRTATVQFKEVVLELNVTPTITQDNRVFLKMNIKKDDLDGYVEALSYRVPQISKREITTQVLVENGQTVVLGGVYEFTSRSDLKKVPFLGDLPALGNLFKSRSKQENKAELLMFVTPQILRLGSKME